MATAHTLMTGEQFDRLPEDELRPTELLDGELLEVASASYEHNVIADTLLISLRGFLHDRKLGMAVRETEFAIGEYRRLRPDVAAMLTETVDRIEKAKVPLRVVPDVVIEVISPSEAASQVDRKVKAYLDAGVSEVIIVHSDTAHIWVVSKTGAAHYWMGGTLVCATIPGWSMAVDQVFAT